MDGELRAARYDVGEQLGRGGMGTIFRAHDRELDRAVAYKRLRVDSERTRAAMTALFRREFEIMLALEHPCTVQAFDFGFDAQGPFYTMELLSGSDLSKLAPMPWRTACAVMRDVASALALLHARRLVHRDVSPNNVRVLADGSAKLLDYGALTPFGPPRDVVGTPAFMSPECARGQELDGRADLFSLGALAYWLLTRRTSFPARSIEELEDAWSLPLRAPSTQVPEIPVELDELLLHLLKLDRDARPDDAAHVIERLTAIAQLPPERDVDAIARSFLARPALAERDQALSTMRGLLTRAREGQGGVILLEANAGLGRTALLEQLTTEAQLDGMQVLRAVGVARSAPFTLLRTLLQAQDAPTVAAGSAAEVADLRAHTAERLQNELLARGAMVIAVDDAQLADADSLRVLSALSGTFATRPVCLLLSVDAGTPLEPEVRAKLEQHAERVTLQPLSAAGIAQLAASVLGNVPHARRAASELFEASSGSPGTATDLLRTLLHQGEIAYAGGTFTVPQTLELARVPRQALQRARMADLDAPTHLVATLLARSTVPLSRAQLQQASALSQRDVALALTALMRRGLVQATPGESYTLGSPLLRAELDELDPATRASHHATIAEVILAANPSDAPTRIAAGAHIIRSGVDELRGAHIIAEACHHARYEVASLSSLVPSLEAALAVYERHGRPDAEAARLFVPLALSGFFGELDAQNRHLPRTLAVLAHNIGLDRVPRLAWLGPKLALYLSLLIGFAGSLFARRARSFRTDLQAFFGVVASAVAAYVSAFDARAAMRVASALEPFAVMDPRTGPAIAREFAWSTIDVSCGRMEDAAQRLARIEQAIAQGTQGIDAQVLVLIQRGVLNGRAQLAVAQDDARVLEYATALQSSSAFFAPHAEAARVGYYGLRGEDQLSDEHRVRAEDAALRGGLSWSANGVVLFWLLQRYAATENAVGLMHVVAALEPMQAKSPGLRMQHALALASLARLRGQYEEAAQRYASVFDSEGAKLLPYYGTDRAYQAECLQRLGHHAEARQLCLDTLAELPETGRARNPHRRALQQQLALLAALDGACEEARASLQALLALESGNPLTLGSLHHDLALVAILAGKQDEFLAHASVVEQHYRATSSASLLARHERLIARARRAGLLSRPPAADTGDDLGDTHVEGSGRDSVSSAPPRAAR